MKLVWRLASGRYPPLTGEGARRVGGRWNSPGRAVVYTSESLALCLAECLVHIPGPLPRDYVAFRLALPDDAVEYLDLRSLRPDWRNDLGHTHEIGDEWLIKGRSLALAVPSIVLPDSTNFLLNPQHPRAHEIELIEQTPFEFDPRLRPGR